ncbi:ABC transporter permease [Variovorax sp. J22R133]|uniref:ABC transporter permease n=1 Tax=Variovorax brevis TaxID=3053503 RepID=UPI0025782F2C|nr:ABC transporter permease [Variovorax sp. J22R133]MDM0116121.1 ABC transporter permease [Variovorax sp. J22R133]
MLAPQTLSLSVLAGIAPFIAVLGLASVGQHLVIQQRGFDLSVAGVLSFAAVMATALPAHDAGPFATAMWSCLAVGTGLLAGAVSGWVVTRLGVSPLVTTIGVNAVMMGLALYVSGGVPVTAPASLTGSVTSTWFGLSPALWLLLVVTVAGTFLQARSTLGRRFIAVGVNPGAAAAMAIPVRRIQWGTYTVAGGFFALAGVLLAGFLVTPTVSCGAPYMLTTVAAVVVGGNPLNGDRGSLMATVVGAIFLTYLDQLVLSLGFEASMQAIVQAGIILAGVALPEIFGRLRSR